MSRETVTIPEVLLNSGHKMPMLGFGTVAAPLPSHDELTSIFVDAIEVGYRHFDTAAAYGSEASVGRAVAEAVERGLIKSRSEVFITSKLWCSEAHPDLVLPALKETLKKLGGSYVDLYLIHWPVRIKQGTDYFRFSKEDILPFDIRGTWEAMENCFNLGLAKSIGVSNFSCAKLSQLLHHATIPPAVNQVEMNVAWRQDKMVEFCKGKGIHVSAWSPLGANGAQWGSLAVMDSHVLRGIANAKHITVPQVAIRWITKKGSSAIVKSFNKERMRENLKIFEYEISEEEMGEIEENIPQRKGFAGECFVSENGPYKSVDQLWDGDHLVSVVDVFN